MKLIFSLFLVPFVLGTAHAGRADDTRLLPPRGACASAIPVRIILIDPNPAASQVLARRLSSEGFDVLAISDPRTGFERVKSLVPDMVVTEFRFGVSAVTGLDLVRQMRLSPALDAVPIVVTASLPSEADQINLFEAGADEVVVRPFFESVFIRRIKTILSRLRRAADRGKEALDVIEVGALKIDFGRYRVHYLDQELMLTPTEFALLRLLAKQPGRVFSRHQITQDALGGAVLAERTVDVHVRSLRGKFKSAGAKSLQSVIGTRRGAGYFLNEEKLKVSAGPQVGGL